MSHEVKEGPLRRSDLRKKWKYEFWLQFPSNQNLENSNQNLGRRQ